MQPSTIYHTRHANKSALVQQPVQECATRRGIEAVQNAPIRSAEHRLELPPLVNEYLHRVGNPPLRKGSRDHKDGHLRRGPVVDRSVGARRVPADLLRLIQAIGDRTCEAEKLRQLAFLVVDTITAHKPAVRDG